MGNNRLSDKIAIVTGGAGGIGQATAHLFAQEGARVVVADLDADAGTKTIAEIHQNNGSAIFVEADISQEQDAQLICEKAISAYGGIDILINNAATFVLKGIDATIDDWNRSLSVNVVGTARVSHYAVQQMKSKCRGAIVNLSSISGFIAQSDFITYSATKAALLQMTRNMAMDFAPYNIRVNCVCPGTILTRASYDHMERTGTSLEEFLQTEGPKHLGTSRK